MRQASGPFKLAKPSSIAEAHSLVGGQPGSEGASGFLRSNCRKGSCECPKEDIWAGSAAASQVRPGRHRVPGGDGVSPALTGETPGDSVGPAPSFGRKGAVEQPASGIQL